MGAPTSRFASGLLARLILGMALIFIAMPAPAQSEGQRVDRVEIEGLIGYRPADLLPRLKVQPGHPYNATDRRADLDYLTLIMRTASVRTEVSSGGGLVVIYTVTEYPRFRTLQIIGNQRLGTAQIEKLIKLKPGEVLSEQALTSLKRALRDKYRDLGMPQVSIDPKIIDVAPDPKAENPVPQADLQVVIQEGKQVLVKDLILEGNEHFTSIRLRLLLQTKGSWGFVKNYYDDKTFEEDLGKLRAFYEQRGYFDAKVERGPFKEETRGTTAMVSPVIRIHEDARYNLGKVTILGARLFSQADVYAPFTGLEGKPYDFKNYSAACEQLLSLYQDHGLLTTQFAPPAKYDYDEKKKTLNVTIYIDEKERIYVGKIKLVRPVYEDDEQPSRFRRWYNRFSPPVKEETVLREVLLKPGEVYSRRLEKDTIRHLAALGVFEAGKDPNGEDMLRAYNEPSGEEGIHNVVIQATEANTGQIGGGVGYGDVSGPFVFASFSDRNVGGQANALSVQAMLGTRDSSLVVSFLDRHIGNSDNSLTYRAYLQNQILPGYRANVIGTSVEFGHPLSNTWTLFLRPRLEFVSLSRGGTFFNGNHNHHSRTDEDLDVSYPVATGRARVYQDTRWPVEGRTREGYQQAYSLEAGYAGGPLLRFEAMRDQYFPINATGSVTYRAMGFAGMMPFDRSVVPIHERYFLGGDTDMRGFRYRGAGYFDQRDDQVPIGGAAKLLLKNEIGYPIYDPVSGVVFADVGTLGKSPVSYQVPRLSTGVGVRFDMRRVQVALDFAIPVLTQSDDQTRFFHFSLQGEL